MTDSENLTINGREVRLRRAEMGYTQEELADEAGVDAKTISNLELGKHWPYPKNQARIEKALGWPAGSLAGARLPVSAAPESHLTLTCSCGAAYQLPAVTS